MKEELLDFLKMNDVKIKENVKLCELSPVKIGAEADLIAYPDSLKKLANLLHYLETTKINYKILGRMSNVLPPDDKYTPMIVKTDLLNDVLIKDQSATLQTGVSLSRLSSMLASAGLSGVEPLSGIPGSVGGAIFGNAGAFGREISDLIKKVIAFDRGDGRIIQIDRDEAEFGYRDSAFKKSPLVVLEAEIQLNASDPQAVRAEVERYKAIRREKQPFSQPSLGSTFKRPGKGLYAAKMIDECGLKGAGIGGVQISEKHAGFIVNRGGARAKDYLALSDLAIKCVKEKFGIELEREIEIL